MEKTDRDTTLAELQKVVQKFCEERDWDPFHGPKDLAIGLVTEASELLEIFRFVREKDLGEVLKAKRGEIADELADSLYFILRFAQLYKIDLSRSMASKMKKNAVKYPAPTKSSGLRAMNGTRRPSKPLRKG
jgi:NTP pyrophosphatase (non-canonical NTP hydrolase)